jgi:hypothetical protein
MNPLTRNRFSTPYQVQTATLPDQHVSYSPHYLNLEADLLDSSSNVLPGMTNDIKVCGASAMTHRQACRLHDDERIGKCSGTLKGGRPCAYKATGPSAPGVMPTCKIHRHQLKVPAWCKAPLLCGFECGRLFEWKPHGFQLCPRHLENSMTCHFLKIPIEIRCRVYQYLLPDRVIPARCMTPPRVMTSNYLRTDMAILRVNHQIYEEATNLLYCTRLFTIEVSDNALSMCNLANEYVSCSSP